MSETAWRFNSRTPCGVRPSKSRPARLPDWFQFTHPVWGATLSGGGSPIQNVVSIHAPRVGCDPRHVWRIHASRSFNSRTPCGVRLRLPSALSSPPTFQFTHPVWGATPCCSAPAPAPQGFNSRTPCGVRQLPPVLRSHLSQVSIHAPRVGCDRIEEIKISPASVSIHAPRVGCDSLLLMSN